MYVNKTNLILNSMYTEFGEKLQNAMDSIESLTWKDKNGNDIKLMQASSEDIQKWYKHCFEMLYNPNPWSPGKYVVRDNIHKTWDSCNTELFVRYLLHECDTEIKTKNDILCHINNQRENSEENILDKSISILFNGLDPIFEKITVSRLMDACFDKLGILNRKMITDKFILSQGIWLTDEEKVELTEMNESGKPRNRMEVIKERLCLSPDIKLRVSPTGLSFSEFRSLVQLSPLPKISLLSTTALKTLRDKVLLLLDNDLNYHIDKWSTLINNIRRVAEARNISLSDSKA